MSLSPFSMNISEYIKVASQRKIGHASLPYAMHSLCQRVLGRKICLVFLVLDVENNNNEWMNDDGDVKQ